MFKRPFVFYRKQFATLDDAQKEEMKKERRRLLLFLNDEHYVYIALYMNRSLKRKGEKINAVIIPVNNMICLINLGYKNNCEE